VKRCDKFSWSFNYNLGILYHGNALGQEVSCWLLTVKFRVRSHVGPCKIFWGTKWQCERFSSEYLGFPLSVSCKQCSTFNFIYMLLLLHAQTVEACEPSKQQYSLEIEKNFIQKYFHFFHMSMTMPSLRPFTVEVRFQSQVSPYEICDGQSTTLWVF
jgi:hypothetical protein